MHPPPRLGALASPPSRLQSDPALREAYANALRPLDAADAALALVDCAEAGWRVLYANEAWHQVPQMVAS